jgi:hypothetical protein
MNRGRRKRGADILPHFRRDEKEKHHNASSYAPLDNEKQRPLVVAMRATKKTQTTEGSDEANEMKAK